MALRELQPTPEPIRNILEQTIGDSEFQASVRIGLLNMRTKIFATGQPLYYWGWQGKLVHNLGTHEIEQQLVREKFRHSTVNTQNRLLSSSFYACPVSLTVHNGFAGEASVQFNWPRGQVTRVSVLENEVLCSRLQGTLYQMEPPGRILTWTGLNIGVICRLTARELVGWLYVGTKSISPKVLECAEVIEICNERYDEGHIPDILPPSGSDNDSGTDFILGERPTGTD